LRLGAKCRHRRRASDDPAARYAANMRLQDASSVSLASSGAPTLHRNLRLSEHHIIAFARDPGIASA
jgi:hypothetical protein